jgi:hypothetical protein
VHGVLDRILLLAGVSARLLAAPPRRVPGNRARARRRRDGRRHCRRRAVGRQSGANLGIGIGIVVVLVVVGTTRVAARHAAAVAAARRCRRIFVVVDASGRYQCWHCGRFSSTIISSSISNSGISIGSIGSRASIRDGRGRSDARAARDHLYLKSPPQSIVRSATRIV